jgi:hypothetical protein
MAETPQERRRRAKASEPAPSEAREPREPSDSSRSRTSTPPGLAGRVATRGAMVWPLITGLALGFAFGREAWRFGLGGGTATDPTAASTAFIAAEAPGKSGAAVVTPQPGWVKDSDIGNGATLFAGLSEGQKSMVMAALNQRNCECGCAFGTLASCLQKDPNCPRSPMIAKLVVDLVKQGKSVPELLAAIDAKQKDMAGGQKPAAAPEPPSGPRPVEIAMWNPRKGPKAAKVTVVEFSDFQ